MRIGMVYRHDVGGGNYRAIGPGQALARKGHQVLYVVQAEDESMDARPLYHCDVVHFYRRADPTVIRLAKDLRRQGIAINWDNDDDARVLPPDGPESKILTPRRVQEIFRDEKRMIALADTVTTTSSYLAGCYGDAGHDHVVLIENYLQSMQYARGPRKHRGFVIGWVAGLEHRADERALRVSDILGRVMERHARVRVVSVGVRLGLDPDRYTHHALVGFDRLRDHIRRFDLAIAPVADIPMTYARSNVKVKEYAGAGTAWLASARGPYEGLGPREGGTLVADDGWDAAFDALIGSKLTLLRLRRRSQAWGKSQAIERHVGQWEDVLRKAMARAGERRVAKASALGTA